MSADAGSRTGSERHDGHEEVVRELAAARDRLGELTSTGLEIARRFLAEARIVIGTPGSVAADPVFAAAGPASPPFGLLVLDRAEELTERDFARLSRLAGRWVLAGDAACPDEAPPAANGTRGPDRLPEPTFVARLAPLLDREPMTIEGDRLVFRLLHLSREQRRAAAREPVLDHPHVELRMTAGDDGDPVLAEIAFPADTPIAAAKAFLFSQLGEVVLRPCGERHWQRSADRLTACWPVADVGPSEWVDLEPGVHEKVVGAGISAFSAAITFDLAAGWDEATAEAWLAAHAPPASASRRAVLPRAPAGAIRAL